MDKMNNGQNEQWTILKLIQYNHVQDTPSHCKSAKRNSFPKITSKLFNDPSHQKSLVKLIIIRPCKHSYHHQDHTLEQ